MKKYNTEILKSLFYEYGQLILIVILFFLLFKSCQKNSDVKLATDTQKKATKDFVANSETFLLKVDSLKTIAVKLKNQIALTKNDSVKTANENIRLKNIISNQLKTINSYSRNDIARSYQKTHNTKEGIVVTQYGVALSDDLAKKNLIEAALCEGIKKEIEIVKTDLQKQKVIIKQQDQYIEIADQMNVNFNLANTEKDKALESQQATIKTVEKGFRSEKNKKNFWKGTAVIMTALGGLLYISK